MSFDSHTAHGTLLSRFSARRVPFGQGRGDILCVACAARRTGSAIPLLAQKGHLTTFNRFLKPAKVEKGQGKHALGENRRICTIGNKQG